MPLLTHLSFNFNDLILEFPEFITDCRNLTYLDLSQNYFTGPIPEWVFSNLVKLEFLYLFENSFQGLLSPNISRLSNLQNLRLGSNQFSGPIPEDIGMISDLQNIEMYDNWFEGKIPSSIGQLRKLQGLDLHMNGLNSTIPTELGLCTSLTFLNLAMNSLTGVLPLSFDQSEHDIRVGFARQFFVWCDIVLFNHQLDGIDIFTTTEQSLQWKNSIGNRPFNKAELPFSVQ